MPTETAAQTLRLTVAVTLSFGLGQLVGWQMAFIAPILTVMVVKSPQPFSFNSGAAMVLTIAGTFAAVLLLILPLLQYPSVATLLIITALFWVFYAGQVGFSQFAVLMLLIALTMVPVIGLDSPALSVEIARGLALAGFVAILFGWLAHALVPPGPDHGPEPTTQTLSASANPVRTALMSTVMVAPVVLVFLLFGLTSYILIVVFITLLAMQPDVASGFKGAIGLIAGNVLGGLIAIVIYQFAIVTSDLFLLSLLIALTALTLGPRIFAGGASGAVCSTALTTVLLIVGMSVSPIGPDAEAKFISRIIQVVFAGVYITGACALSEVLFRSPGIASWTGDGGTSKA